MTVFRAALMRSLFLGLALLSCSDLQTSVDSLDGVWRLESVRSPMDPRVLTLTQSGATVSGTGNAMGVDAPIPLTVAGTNLPPSVILNFAFTNGGGGTARYTATLVEGGRLVGRAVFDDVFGNTSDSLTFTRQR